MFGRGCPSCIDLVRGTGRQSESSCPTDLIDQNSENRKIRSKIALSTAGHVRPECRQAALRSTSASTVRVHSHCPSPLRRRLVGLQCLPASLSSVGPWRSDSGSLSSAKTSRQRHRSGQLGDGSAIARIMEESRWARSCRVRFRNRGTVVTRPGSIESPPNRNAQPQSEVEKCPVRSL